MEQATVLVAVRAADIEAGNLNRKIKSKNLAILAF